MKKIIPIIAFLFVVIDTNAQQDPHYTQYMYNMNVINPAYAGSKEDLSLGLLYRKQWVQLDGAPSTFTLSGHSPLGNNVGGGLSFIGDQLGPIKENNIYADISYTLNLGGEHKLAFGVKAGATTHSISLLGDVSPYLQHKSDLAFASNYSGTTFNVGAGLFYYTDKYYLAFSVPNFIKSQHLDVNAINMGEEVSHYFLTGGYVFDLNESVKFKPFGMVKTAFGAPVSIDASTNFLFYEKFEIGATYRLEDSFGAMVSFAILPTLKIGYAYDHIVSDLSVETPSSHEIIILFDINSSKRVSRSARYF